MHENPDPDVRPPYPHFVALHLQVPCHGIHYYSIQPQISGNTYSLINKDKKELHISVFDSKWKWYF